jgi:hypothetical protein
MAAASAVLCVATCVLWVSSYRLQIQLSLARRGHTFLQLTSKNGDLYLDVVENWPDACTGCRTGSPNDHFGPIFCPSNGFCTETVWANTTLMKGSFSVAIVNGRVLMDAQGDFYEMVRGVSYWPMRRGIDLRMPHGYYLAVLSIAPLAWAGVRLRRVVIARRRRGLRLCLSCGYDLRATPDRCPECGAEPMGKSRAEVELSDTVSCRPFGTAIKNPSLRDGAKKNI